MTEHCINNGSSICQTEDATHLILTYQDYKPNKTIGFTYSGEQAELMFNLKSDPEAPVYRMILHVTNFSNQNFNVLIYDDPHDNTTHTTLTAVPSKGEIKLYTIREFKFSNKDEIIIFVRFGDNIYDIDEEELQRLYKSLASLHDDPEFSDMTVQNESGDQIRCHRGVLAAATAVLDEHISVVNLIEENNASEEVIVKEHSISPGKSSDEPDLNTNTLFDIREEDNKRQQFADIVAAFADKIIDNNLNVDSVNNKEALVQILRENVQEIINVPVDKTAELNLIQPNPKNYKLFMNGLRSKNNFEELLRFMYTGEFKICYKLVDNFINNTAWVEKTDEILCVVYLYNLHKLADTIETNLISIIAEHTVIDILQIAKQYNLERLKHKSIKFLRNPIFFEIAQEIKDPCVHKCIISKPEHKFADQIHFAITQRVLTLSNDKWAEAGVHNFCGYKLHVFWKYQNYSNVCYLGIDLVLRSPIFSRITMTIISKKSESLSITCQDILRKGNKKYRTFAKIMPRSEFEKPENQYVVDGIATFDFYVEALEE